MNSNVLKWVTCGLSIALVVSKAYLQGNLDAEHIQQVFADVMTAVMAFGAGAVTIKRGEDMSPQQVNARLAELDKKEM